MINKSATVRFKDQDYIICVDDDTRMAIDDVIKYQRSHPERTTVTIEPRLKSLRQYVGQKKSRFERFLDWFDDPRNAKTVCAIGIIPMVLVGIGFIVVAFLAYRDINRSENHVIEVRTEEIPSANKPSYEVIEFK